MEQRVIKFRAWDGTFMMDPYCELREHNQFWGEDLTNTPYKSPISVMQFTGLHDMNGKEIHESDVIEDHFGHIWTVVFQDGCFWLYQKGFRTTNQMMSWPVDCYPMFRVDHAKHSKVIGNIHQNPELLK